MKIWHGKQENFPDFESLEQEKFQSNPIEEAEAAREEFKAAHNGYNERLRDTLQRAYGIAYAFRKRPSLWHVFSRQPIFDQNAQKPNDKNHLKWVLIFIMGATEKRDRDRANKYARALRPYQERGVPTHKVARRVKKDGGIEALIKKAGKKKADPAASETNPPDDSYYDLGPSDEPDPDDLPKLVIEVECTPDQLARAMKIGRKGRTMLLRARGLGKTTREQYGKPVGWQRLKTVAINRRRDKKA